MAILFKHSEFLPEICWKEVAEEMFFSYFVELEMSGLISQHNTY